jgi:protein gp37
MNKTSIEWTHRPETGGGFTWNPIRANLKGPRAERPHSGTFCTRISPGCKNCYASAINMRFGSGLEYTVPNLERVEFFIDEKILQEPIRRKKPATIFVGDMFDLFHEAIPIIFVGRVFDMMAKCPQHTFQVLTKRAAYMQAILSRAEKYSDKYIHVPLPNLWIGVSVEDRERETRIDFLRNTPAAVRFISFEPALEDYGDVDLSGIDWAIFGGESGPGARPCNLAWAESLHARCQMQKYQTAFFMKQIGSNPWMPNDMWHGVNPPKIKDSKGGDMSEWPEALRVREWPSERLASA